MTAAERDALRKAIDAARRAQLADVLGVHCITCFAPLDQNPSRPQKRFCSPRCRTYHWYHNTERGRAALVRKKRRWRRRKGIPQRPTHEVTL